MPALVPQDATISWSHPFTSVSVADGHICGVREDGAVICWRDDDPWGQDRPPEGRFTSVSAGLFHACGVREDGSVACWGGRPPARPVRPPEGRFTSVSAGAWHTCGLKEDGTVACWKGDGPWGQTGLPEGRFTSLSAGSWHTCGLKEDGAVACWGSDDAEGPATPPEGRFASVSVGLQHICGVREDGAVACRGDIAGADIFLPGSSFKSVSVGQGLACGLREDRTVACWDLYSGTTAVGRNTPPQGAFTSVNLGGSTACGVREDGSVACWGEVNVPRPVVLITGRTSHSLTVEWLDPWETDAFDYYQIHASSSHEGPHSLVTSSLEEGTHVHGGLDPDTTYYLVVLACHQFGCSSEAVVAATESEGPVSIPSSPSGFRGEKIEIDNNPDDARLTWDAVEGATHYELWKGSDPNLPFEMLVRVSAPLHAQSVDIAPNRGYFGDYSLTSWKVRSCNKAGCSPFSKTVTIR